jgi:hypothetical protein
MLKSDVICSSRFATTRFTQVDDQVISWACDDRHSGKSAFCDGEHWTAMQEVRVFRGIEGDGLLIGPRCGAGAGRSGQS